MGGVKRDMGEKGKNKEGIRIKIIIKDIKVKEDNKVVVMLVKKM